MVVVVVVTVIPRHKHMQTSSEAMCHCLVTPYSVAQGLVEYRRRERERERLNNERYFFPLYLL